MIKLAQMLLAGQGRAGRRLHHRRPRLDRPLPALPARLQGDPRRPAPGRSDLGPVVRRDVQGPAAGQDARYPRACWPRWPPPWPASKGTSPKRRRRWRRRGRRGSRWTSASGTSGTSRTSRSGSRA
ncbi:MAG: hypothetical protein MZU79_05085 [Anaerotruncus sp.]|nr:hypothetical protein [Anaerotruncus sp.]